MIPRIRQVGDLLDQPGVRAGQTRPNAAVRVRREALHVQLIDDGAGKLAPQRPIPFPVVGPHVHDHTLAGGTVVPIRSPGEPVIPRRNRDRPAVRVKQHRARVVAQAAWGVVHPVGPPGVQLARGQPGHEHMPVRESAVIQRVQAQHPRRPRIINTVKQQQIHAGRGTRPDREVHTLASHPGPQGVGQPRADASRHEAILVPPPPPRRTSPPTRSARRPVMDNTEPSSSASKTRHPFASLR